MENVTLGKKTYSAYFDDLLRNPTMLGDTMEVLAKQSNAEDLTKSLQRELLTRIVQAESPQMAQFMRGETMDMSQDDAVRLANGFEKSLYDNLELLTNVLGKKKVEDLFIVNDIFTRYLMSPRMGANAQDLQPRSLIGRMGDFLGFTESWAGARLIALKEGRVGAKTTAVTAGLRI